MLKFFSFVKKWEGDKCMKCQFSEAIVLLCSCWETSEALISRGESCGSGSLSQGWLLPHWSLRTEQNTFFSTVKGITHFSPMAAPL